MHLSKHDLFQMNDEWLKKLPAELLLEVSKRLLHDVKELQDRLNQNPGNSSRPPTSQPPWAKTGGSEEQSGAADERDTADVAAETAGSSTEETEQAPPVYGQRPSAQKGSGKRPGKQPGSAGHGRSQKLAITARCEHRPEICAACAAALWGDAASQAYTAWDEVDIAPPVEGLIGLTFSVTRHTLLEVSCSCGHVSRAQPWRAPADGQWDKVELGEWRLVGPRLSGVIVLLALRMRLSRARIRELLMELFELTLSTGVIDETIREAGRASLPLEDALVADIVQAAQLHVDETSWPESGTLLWLWALVTTHTVLFLIGPRSREMLENALQDGFAGLLISDGYGVYRAWANRLRCWPHLLRKLRGLAESSDARVSGVGQEMEGIMKTLMAAIYAARIDPPPEGLPARYANEIKRLRYLCEAHQTDQHSVLRGVVREFLYDWDVILRPVAEPHLPPSNNAAEQALRHWVISRAISHGTRSEEGSRAFAFLASLIETCRRRGASAWQYLGTVIAAARKGLQLPAIPATV
ncbi:IS66 family transposase [Accumulibacter sp.]|jgi:transposase|uniref:IS66 family transposase n=1 Tax=Accumulibacter sp. TaxID=2053492 RepID=UPI003DA8CAC5